MEYTKGEWRTAYRERPDGKYAQEVFDNKGETIATLAWHAVQETPRSISTDREANAHLIAAAPKLYQYVKGRAEEGDNDAKLFLSVLGLE